MTDTPDKQGLKGNLAKSKQTNGTQPTAETLSEGIAETLCANFPVSFNLQLAVIDMLQLLNNQLHDSIMRDELKLGSEPDQAFNYARIHRWIDLLTQREYSLRLSQRLATTQKPRKGQS